MTRLLPKRRSKISGPLGALCDECYCIGSTTRLTPLKREGEGAETSKPQFNEQESSLKDGTRAGQTDHPQDQTRENLSPGQLESKISGFLSWFLKPGGKTPRRSLEARHSSLLWHCLPIRGVHDGNTVRKPITVGKHKTRQVKSDALGLKKREPSRTLTMRKTRRPIITRGNTDDTLEEHA